MIDSSSMPKIGKRAIWSYSTIAVFCTRSSAPLRLINLGCSTRSVTPSLLYLPLT